MPPEFIVLAVNIVPPYEHFNPAPSTTTIGLQYSQPLIHASKATNAYKNVSSSFLFIFKTDPGYVCSKM